MKYLSLEQILQFHTKIIKSTGGSDGVRDLGLIEQKQLLMDRNFMKEI
ncbi:hypothetical protein DFQ00_111207 [Paenibacillus barcinonensis]|uniref:Uncharacterized protein n=1 Tax=Paenibacillus barcinonensis TaxID=198119 RepID=A0A2V4VGP7_PAEBA|nr:hypothetical protein DFQ00_111207 [Paenibacillus barcinonensis]